MVAGIDVLLFRADGELRRLAQLAVDTGVDGAANSVRVVDTTMRDGDQSVWSGTGLRTVDVVSIAPTMDRVGYHAADCTASTFIGIWVRFHQEDPWERLRRMSEAMPNTPLSMITTGMRFIAWVPAGEDVMELAFRCVARNGVRRLQIADPGNDPERLRRVAALARRGGIEQVVIGLTYSQSPIHPWVLGAARRGAGRLCRHGPAVPQGPRRAADARHGPAGWRPTSSPPPASGRWSCTATAR